jgi:hypothetical protein
MARIMKAKYHPNCSVLEAKLGNKPSFVWRSIQSYGGLIKEGLIWRVGNGQSIRLQGEKWLPLPTTYKVQSPLTTIHEEARVCELIDQDTHWWNVNLIKEAFNDEECKAIQTIPPSLTNRPDVQIWRGTAKGEFSISSAYHMAKELKNKDRAESSS